MDEDSPWDRPVRRAAERPVLRLRPSGPVPWELAVDTLLQRSGWATRTRQKAREILIGGRLRDYRAARGIRHLDDFTDEHAAEFMAGLAAAGLAAGTLIKTRQVLIALQRLAASTPGYASGMRSVESAVARTRAVTRIVRVLTPAEELLVLRACRHERDRLMVEVLLSCGLRSGELVALRVGDLALDEGRPYLHVRRSWHSATTKARRDRIVPLNWAGGTLGRRLRRYVETARPSSHRLEVFLALRSDGHGDHAALTPEAVHALLERLGQDTGLHLHPHLLRHTWATRAANAGVPMPLLQEAGGWRSLAMVQRYYTAEREAMLEAFSRAHRG